MGSIALIVKPKHKLATVLASWSFMNFLNLFPTNPLNELMYAHLWALGGEQFKKLLRNPIGIDFCYYHIWVRFE
jgi:hypothetical protein